MNHTVQETPSARTPDGAPASSSTPYERDGVSLVTATSTRGPAVDVTRIVTTTEVVVGAVLVARELARRPGAPRARVTMGPGGWVSMKGGTVAVRPGSRPWGRPRPVPATEPSRRAPLWARVLSAVPLRSLVR